MAMSKISTFAAGAIVALVLGSGTAVAATGGKFILGKSNTETTTATLSNSKGTALSLNSKAGTPPLKVNNGTKVPNLNSDRLDGLSSESFARTAGQAASVDAQGVPVDLDATDQNPDGDGVDDAVIATASCPSGTQLTGGGVDDETDTGQIWTSATDPDVAESWTVVVGIDGTTEKHDSDVWATAVCYNPRGAVNAPGAYGFAARQADPLARFSAERVERLRQQADARRR